MKTSLPIGIVIAASILLLCGCGDKPAVEQNKSTPKATTETQTPASDPGRSIDETFLIEQTGKRQQLEATIRAFWDAKQGDPKEVRRLILNRKGEILTTKRNIRNSMLFTNAEKDSLLKPLDDESMILSKELIAFSE
jgi:type IV pilus biogenesis protein CpaD/CtpE